MPGPAGFGAPVDDDGLTRVAGLALGAADGAVIEPEADGAELTGAVFTGTPDAPPVDLAIDVPVTVVVVCSEGSVEAEGTVGADVEERIAVW